MNKQDNLARITANDDTNAEDDNQRAVRRRDIAYLLRPVGTLREIAKDFSADEIGLITEPITEPVTELINKPLTAPIESGAINLGDTNAIKTLSLTHQLVQPVRVTLYTRFRSKQGELNQIREHGTDLWAVMRDQANYLDEADPEIIETLAVARSKSRTALGPTARDFQSSEAEGLLLQMIATGRAYWYDSSIDHHSVMQWLETGHALRLESAATAPIDSLMAESNQWVILDSTPPYQLNVVTGEVCRSLVLNDDATEVIEQDSLASLAKHSLSAEQVTAHPATTGQTRVVRKTPKLSLFLTSELLDETPAQGYLRSTNAWVDYARVTFDYDGYSLNPASVNEIARQTPYIIEEADLTVRIERDFDAERNAIATLTQQGLELLENLYPIYKDRAAYANCFALRNREAWVNFFVRHAPALKKSKARIHVAPEFRVTVVAAGPIKGAIRAAARPTKIDAHRDNHTSANDWFTMDLGIDIAGKSMPLNTLLAMVAQTYPRLFTRAGIAQIDIDETLVLHLPDGRYVTLLANRLRAILSVFVELLGERDSGEVGLTIDRELTLSRMDAARLAQAQTELGINWSAPTELLELAAQLQSFAGITPVAPPTTLQATMRPYQIEGLSWLQFLRAHGLAGILADDMGLGKTLQTLAHILIEKEAGRLTRPALVVAPTSLVHNWQTEAKRFTPSLSVLALHGAARKQSFDDINKHDLIITTYPLLVRDKDVLTEERFHLVVLDEAQSIKNANAQATKVVRDLRTTHRLCLSGTPLENHLGELWSLFSFLAPGFLGDNTQFNKRYRVPIEKYGDEFRRSQLAARVRPLILRRTKEQVAPELPAKTHILRSVTLEDAQRDLYETLRASLDSMVRTEVSQRGLKQSHFLILDALLKLRQVCCDPRLVKLEAAREINWNASHSAKLDLLMTLLHEMLPEGRKVIVFSQFTSMLALIEAELTQRGISYSLLTGDTRDRQSEIEAFQNGDNPVFLVSLKAGGTGLNLTAADTVIHYDPWWNPAAENQATDRAHRIGQTKPVFVYRLIAAGSIEEKIQALQQRKAELAKGILEGAQTNASEMNEEDLRILLSPLES